jgi:hypothetical protein
MSDKERLQMIKEKQRKRKDGLSWIISFSDVEWLIEQAEKKEYWERQHKILENRFQQVQEYIEQQQQKIKHLKEENKKHVSVVTDYAIENLNLKQQLQQTQTKVEIIQKLKENIIDTMRFAEKETSMYDNDYVRGIYHAYKDILAEIERLEKKK